MAQAIIFDNEGVLVDTDWDAVAIATAEAFGLGVTLSGKDYKKLLQGSDGRLDNYSKGLMGYVAFWGGVLNEPYFQNQKELPITSSRLSVVSGALESLVTDINLDMVRLIEELKKADYLAIMLSNATPEIHRGNPHLKVYQDLFDVLYFSFQTRTRKPEEEAYRMVLRKHNLNPGEVAVIDDKAENLAIPIQLGIPSLQYNLRGQRDIAFVRSWLIDQGFDRLSRPHVAVYTAQTPQLQQSQ